MPGTTDCRSYPFPVDADPIDVAADITALANAVDDDVCALDATIDGLLGTNPPFALGQLPGGYATFTGSATLGTNPTVVDVPGLSCAVTLVAGRRYKASVNLNLQTNGNVLEAYQIYLRDAANTILQNWWRNRGSSDSSATLQDCASFFYVFTGVGAKTLKVSGMKTSGGLSAIGTGDRPCFLIVEDIGRV